MHSLNPWQVFFVSFMHKIKNSYYSWPYCKAHCWEYAKVTEILMNCKSMSDVKTVENVELEFRFGCSVSKVILYPVSCSCKPNMLFVLLLRVQLSSTCMDWLYCGYLEGGTCSLERHVTVL